MRRRFSIGQLLVAVVVLVVAVVVVGALTHRDTGSGNPADTGQQFTSCPSSALAECANWVAKAWTAQGHRLPAIALPGGAVPDGLRYDRGFILSKEKPPAAFFVFQTVGDAGKQSTEITLRMSRASTQPFDAAHRGGVMRHRTNGAPYLDFSRADHIGPFAEKLDDVEVFVSWTSRSSSKTVRQAQLALLEAVTKPQ